MRKPRRAENVRTSNLICRAGFQPFKHQAFPTKVRFAPLPTGNPDYRLLFHSLICRLILQRQRPIFVRILIELLQATLAAERNRLALVLRVNRFSNVAHLITGHRADRV
jgi:hypothetical protein